jgi:Cu-Zn family superoxide dismutase
MISRTIVFGAVLFCAVLSAANKPVTVTLKDGEGKDVGTAKISEFGKTGVKIALNVKGLTPGEHAVHIHGVAKCEGPKFTTAGGHFNPEMKKHGLDNPEGPHAGDMKNFTVKPDGTAKVTVEDTRVTLADGDHSAFTGGGTALVIHAMPDDLKTDPAGNAGDRIACGTITK